MSKISLYGFPLSTYVRTARMTSVEKGLEHEVVPQQPHTPEQLALHPFGKMPAMKHGNVVLWETTAICRYIDAIGDGPSLIPSGVVEAALMEQWISATNSYLYPRMIVSYALQYILPGFRGEEPNREAIEASVPNMKSSVEFIDKGLAGRDWLVGDSLSLADLFLIPVLQTVTMFSEGKEALGACANAARFLDNVSKRQSFAVAHPQQS